jgi:hypothetical protein
VEIDIHLGLLESLEIYWRGHTVTQRLDYLGIPFRCSICRRTGHLRRDCTGELEAEESEASYLRKISQEDSPDVDSLDVVAGYNVEGGIGRLLHRTHYRVSLSFFVLLYTSLCLLGNEIPWTLLMLWGWGFHGVLLPNLRRYFHLLCFLSFGMGGNTDFGTTFATTDFPRDCRVPSLAPGGASTLPTSLTSSIKTCYLLCNRTTLC